MDIGLKHYLYAASLYGERLRGIKNITRYVLQNPYIHVSEHELHLYDFFQQLNDVWNYV